MEFGLDSASLSHKELIWKANCGYGSIAFHCTEAWGKATPLISATQPSLKRFKLYREAR